jgi:hypothetical protein
MQVYEDTLPGYPGTVLSGFIDRTSIPEPEIFGVKNYPSSLFPAMKKALSDSNPTKHNEKQAKV